MDSQWYVVKVLPGKERKLAEQFNKEISLGKMKNIQRFVCPVEKELVQLKNKKVTREKVLYSGYLYFETTKVLELDELKVMANIQNIMSMGGDKTPILLKDSDIRRILKDDTLEEHLQGKQQKYSIGDSVLITEGPFNTFNAIISEINGEKVVLEVKIFGRNTIVNLTLSQIEKEK